MNIYYLCKYLKERQRAFEGVVYNSLHANRLALGCLCLEARRDASASSLQGSSGHIFFSVYYRLSRLNWSSVLAWLRRQTFGCWLKAKKGNEIDEQNRVMPLQSAAPQNTYLVLMMTIPPRLHGTVPVYVSSFSIIITLLSFLIILPIWDLLICFIICLNLFL